uniref:FBA_2 domain-containing protein n=2 Tax=Caenorhabditis tropicalis TaxID=1561998 RepID=A0A1I7TU03_9PELO
MKTEIRRAIITSATLSMFKIFMNRFKRSIRELYLPERDPEYDENVYKCLNFNVNHYFYADTCPWFNLEFFLNIESIAITLKSIQLSDEDLNMFLRSWQKGKTNRQVRQVVLLTSSARDVKEILKGCGGELMDPRTTQLKFREVDGQEYKWIRGGIHIRRNDGRIAAILNNNRRYSTEDENVSDVEIEKYLEARDIWNSENSPDKWLESDFYIYVF